ncbi:MAG: SPFH domain-containing protein [Anaerolineae bacterium]|nr:SPFH domain-containing protein [Anaerolineae bacterium]
MRIIDVIDHTNVMDDEFTYREPQAGSGDWRFGSQVIVGESQAAVFVRGGEALDILRTGRHTLSTANLPILAGLIGMATSGRTPFTADLYFINLKDMPQIGWGTNPPIPLETPGKGMGAVLLSTHGTMSISMGDPMRFLKKFGVGKPVTRVGDIKTAIQTKLLGELTVLLMGSGVESVPAANGFLGDLEGAALAKLSEEFENEFGIRITSLDANPFRAQQASADELMNYVSLDNYERIKRLQIAETAAGNEGMAGGLAGAGLGLGIGQSMGATMNPGAAEAQQQQQMMQNMMMQQMMQMMNNQQQQPPAQAAPAATSAPQTREGIQGMIDSLDMRFANGEISEAAYNRLIEKWQQKLDNM